MITHIICVHCYTVLSLWFSECQNYFILFCSHEMCRMDAWMSLFIKGSTKCINIMSMFYWSSLSFIITVSGAEGSDSCSLGSSAYSSFRSSEADGRSIVGSSQSRDSSLISRFKPGVLKIFNSMELIPPLSECLLFYLFGIFHKCSTFWCHVNFF